MVNTNITFDEDEYILVKEKEYEHIGKFRVILFDTGYYALQRYDVNDFKPKDPAPIVWETLLIAPQLDTPLDVGYDWRFSQGRLTMNSLLDCFDDADKLRSNELMELHLHLNSNLDNETTEEIIHLISSEDGREIKYKIFESMQLQDDLVEEVLNQKRLIYKVMLACSILILVVVIVFLLFY